MKSGVAISLIVSGVVLICMPPVMGYLSQLNAIRVLEDVKTSHVTLTRIMSDEYGVRCFIAGCAMITVAVVFSLRRPADSRAPGSAPVA